MHSENETKSNGLDGLRAPLTGKRGKQLWRSLEEVAETEEFHQWIEDEFPNRSSLLALDRRQFLTLGGAALALAGLSGCRVIPNSKAVPFVRSPEDLVSGKPLHYATTLLSGGYGIGVLAKSYEGRPIKIEGNVKHPASYGATGVVEQAEILNLYDPDRSQGVLDQGEFGAWDQFTDTLRKVLADQTAKGGAGLRLLMENTTSPTVAGLLSDLLTKFPAMNAHVYDPVNRENVYAGARIAYGQPYETIYDLPRAKVVVALDSDFLNTGAASTRYSRDFSNGRRVRLGGEMNRLYAIESALTPTGATADHRWPVKPSEIEVVARALYLKLSGGTADETPVAWLDKLVADLQANIDAAVVIPGDNATPAVHAYCHAINAVLNAPILSIPPVSVFTESHTESLKALTTAMEAGQVEALVIIGGNPVFNAPADVPFAAALAKVPFKVRHGLYEDETSELCDWHLPAAHTLESWGDARAFDGTVSFQQPLIEPLYGGKSDIEILSEILDQPRPPIEIVKDYARKNFTGSGFDKWWQGALHAGKVSGSTPTPTRPAVNVADVAALPASASPAPGDKKTVEVNFLADATILDGRYANNSWLQELPKPITTLTWDGAAILSPKTAKDLGITPTDGHSDAENAAQASGKAVITLTAGERKVKFPVFIMPGQPNGVISIPLGYGRTKAGKVGTQETKAGEAYEGWFNAYAIRLSDNPSFLTGVAAAPSGDTYRLAATQAHHMMRGDDIHEHDNRDIVRVATLIEFETKKGKVGPKEEGGEHAEGEGHEAVSHKPGPAGEHAETTEHEAPKGQGKEIPADHVFGVGGDNWKYSERSLTDKGEPALPSLYPEYSNKDFNAWAMSIDLSTCFGCNTCMIACQAENNIPTVGKKQVGLGREMHWIRIDHYFSTNAADTEGLEKPETIDSHFMPVPCMQCEKAPCEPVCPVAATVHSHEGLNQMVYNRCIGTRYCSNNCPYKVRRFNFLKWTAGKGGKGTLDFFNLPVLKLATNPDVTVRGRGVMEKCTYCVQRINVARIEAKKDEREIQDGEIKMACEQACPAGAIVFGDLNNPNSRVSQLKRQPHDYSLLEELNTKPRTTYLARVRNTNPAIATTTADSLHED